MNSKFITLAAFLVLALGLNACMQDSALNNPPGTYERSTNSTNSDGTNVKRDSSTEVTVDSEGNKKAVVETKTTTDPEGLFNKTTTTDTKKVIENRY